MLKNRNLVKIFILSDDSRDQQEEMTHLRNTLISNGINRVILVDFQQFYIKLFGSKDERVAIKEIEGISILAENPKKLPIIFYGGEREDYRFFIGFLEWQGRKDIGWVQNPHQIEDIKKIVFNVEICFKL